MPEYVYGIIEPTGAPPEQSGIDGAPLRVIGGDGAAALVSDVPERELRLGREAMLTHARVLEAAIAGGTVLPMRFGVVMESGEVRERLLAGHREQLVEQLRELSGKVELSIRVLYEEEPLMRELVRSDHRIGALRQRIQGQPEDATYFERIELGELIAVALEHRRESDAGELLAELEPVALAVEVGSPTHERMVLGASFLVARDGLERFDRTLDRLAEQRAGRMRFRSVGPLPPHSFVNLDLAGTA